MRSRQGFPGLVRHPNDADRGCACYARCAIDLKCAVLLPECPLPCTIHLVIRPLSSSLLLQMQAGYPRRFLNHLFDVKYLLRPCPALHSRDSLSGARRQASEQALVLAHEPCMATYTKKKEGYD